MEEMQINFRTIIDKGNLVRHETKEAYARILLKTLLNQLKETEYTDNVIDFLNKKLSEIDDVLTKQVNLVLHNPKFQKLEASWLSLARFVNKIPKRENLKIRVLHVTMEEIRLDIKKSKEVFYSNLFKKICAEEYGTFGGHPISCLLGDFYFTAGPEDIEVLDHLAQVASLGHCPMITGASPKLFDLNSFENLNIPKSISRIFDSEDFTEWRNFRKREYTRYLVLTLPRFLLRAPYNLNNADAGFAFQEKLDGSEHNQFAWGNAAFLLGERIANAFAEHGWTAAIRGVEGGGVVRDFPLYRYYSPDGQKKIKCPTEVIIPDFREKEISDMGFLPLCYYKGSDFAVFFGSQTLMEPDTYFDYKSNINEALGISLPYILNTSRFAHYIKVIMREKIGSFLNKEDVARYLNKWISQYVLLDSKAESAIKARFPLREANVKIDEDKGKPGVYKATILLRPHFQLEELSTSLRLVAYIDKNR